MRKRLPLIIILFLAFYFIISSITTAEMSSTNYKISTSVISNGGDLISSINYKINGTLGQSSPMIEQGLAPHSDNYSLLLGFWYTIDSIGSTCPGDFNLDFDVDGDDLAEYISDSSGLGLDVFSANFGKVNCP